MPTQTMEVSSKKYGIGKPSPASRAENDKKVTTLTHEIDVSLLTHCPRDHQTAPAFSESCSYFAWSMPKASTMNSCMAGRRMTVYGLFASCFSPRYRGIYWAVIFSTPSLSSEWSQADVRSCGKFSRGPMLLNASNLVQGWDLLGLPINSAPDGGDVSGSALP